MKKLTLILAIVALWLSVWGANIAAVSPLAAPTQTATAKATQSTPTKPAQSTPTGKVAQPTPAAAKLLPLATVKDDLVNLRSGPGTSYELVGQAVLSDTLQIVGRNAAADWWQVCCTADKEPAWVKAEFVQTDQPAQKLAAVVPVVGTAKPTAAATEIAPASTTPAITITGVISADLVNLRSGPGTQFEIVGSMTLSQTVQISGKDQTGKWWQVNGPTGRANAAWIISEFVAVDKKAPTDKLPVVEVKAAPAEISLPGAPALPPEGIYSPPATLNPLTGLPLAAGLKKQRPVVVCINNDPVARPQYGLSQADVMYEYFMEGYSITRFSGVFYGQSPVRIGPVRSARLINYYLGALYNAPLFCSGASDQVRYMLKNQSPFPYLDIDLDDPNNRHFSDSIGTDYRTRLNTSGPYLQSWKKDWEIEEPANIRGFTFGDLPAGGQPATEIAIPYTKATGADVSYTYNKADGNYRRFMGEETHLDANTGKQIAVENVIIQMVTHQQTDMVEDKLGNKGILLDLFEGNQALIFRDGQVFTGTWQSAQRGDTPHFYDEKGAEIPLKPGQTWISVAPEKLKITYQ